MSVLWMRGAIAPRRASISMEGTPMFVLAALSELLARRATARRVSRSR